MIFIPPTACAIRKRPPWRTKAISSISASSKPAIRRNVRASWIGVLVVFAPEAPEAEQLVDDPLELEGPVAPLGVVLGEAAQPVGAHLHVGDLVGQHPVLAEAEDGVAAGLAELPHRVEDVDGQALEGPVDAGQAQDRVGVAGRLVEERASRRTRRSRCPCARRACTEISVWRASSQHWRAMSSLRAKGASSSSKSHTVRPAPFERLDLADEDAVHHLAGGVGGVGPLRGELAVPDGRSRWRSGPCGGPGSGLPCRHAGSGCRGRGPRPGRSSSCCPHCRIGCGRLSEATGAGDSACPGDERLQLAPGGGRPAPLRRRSG